MCYGYRIVARFQIIHFFSVDGHAFGHGFQKQVSWKQKGIRTLTWHEEMGFCPLPANFVELSMYRSFLALNSSSSSGSTFSSRLWWCRIRCKLSVSQYTSSAKQNKIFFSSIFVLKEKKFCFIPCFRGSRCPRMKWAHSRRMILLCARIPKKI